MLRRWVASGIDPSIITVIDPTAPEVPDGVRVEADMTHAGPYPEAIVLAVKPQMLGEVRQAMSVAMSGDPALLVSVMAGVEERTLQDFFHPDAVVRAMPNLPVALGQGVVALYSGSSERAWRAKAEALMAPLGLVEWIGDEHLFHAVTALSGSGPGFVYRIIEAFAEAGAVLGLPADQALRFAIATLGGSAALAEASGESPAALAERVASPGGTTRAGLDVLDRDGALKQLVTNTLSAAARRSEELAQAARA